MNQGFHSPRTPASNPRRCHQCPRHLQRRQQDRYRKQHPLTSARRSDAVPSGQGWPTRVRRPRVSDTPFASEAVCPCSDYNTSIGLYLFRRMRHVCSNGVLFDLPDAKYCDVLNLSTRLGTPAINGPPIRRRQSSRPLLFERDHDVQFEVRVSCKAFRPTTFPEVSPGSPTLRRPRSAPSSLRFADPFPLRATIGYAQHGRRSICRMFRPPWRPGA